MRPTYARTLETVAEHGADGFYTGEIAQAIVKAVKEAGGVMEIEDLSSACWPPRRSSSGPLLMTTPALQATPFTPGRPLASLIGIIQSIRPRRPPQGQSSSQS